MILDTSVLSDLFREHALLHDRVSQTPALCIPVIVLGEYRLLSLDGHFDRVKGITRLSW
jgi:predicted nucleic acid-binding protein